MDERGPAPLSLGVVILVGLLAGSVRGLRAETTTAAADLDAFAGELTLDDLRDGFWPAYGALLVNVRNILAALGVVADAQPVEVPSPALA